MSQQFLRRRNRFKVMHYCTHTADNTMHFATELLMDIFYRKIYVLLLCHSYLCSTNKSTQMEFSNFVHFECAMSINCTKIPPIPQINTRLILTVKVHQSKSLGLWEIKSSLSHMQPALQYQHARGEIRVQDQGHLFGLMTLRTSDL